MQSLFKEFEEILPLSAEESEIIESKIRFSIVKRKGFLLKEGCVCKHYTFVIKGCFKMYGVDDRGFSHNIQFAAEGDWIADIGSFYTQTASKLNIEALEYSEIYQISQPDLYWLFVEVNKVNRMFKVISESNFVEIQNRVLQNFSSTAEQRYLSFLEQYPHLSNRLPNTQIASYLGITPEFLSKIRKGLSKKGL
ncbi:Crp/Fnr family transcriptional regulator [Lacihabitans soyangensis]|uniref:Crp/Fnr family transcriptional regulator n=1 Tax=Lacihabitans soyangensis TaxID=869394 RepID=A0AAE3KX30_9BACT|nr:Crp/Fnr family transcriptional regulator [Lacihabitans soyangensis]MCP9763960.1 Crp/Fnr family transcriptional regulator [Lacihabitans soyangensis]